ncbi:MAG: NYN domain-containing protein, partial [Desulfobacterales bacterium]|nr:NYN domain-containing protein [Desulfobacterales bacterium]
SATTNSTATAAEKDPEERTQEVLDLIMETLEALAEERGSEEKIWGSMVKQTLKRRRPGFNESYYGFRSFNKLLEEAAARDLMELEPDEKSGGYIIKRFHQED